MSELRPPYHSTRFPQAIHPEIGRFGVSWKAWQGGPTDCGRFVGVVFFLAAWKAGSNIRRLHKALDKGLVMGTFAGRLLTLNLRR
jgi:hypothetical protein